MLFRSKDYKGLFLAPYIIADITAHLEMTANLPDEVKLTVADPDGTTTFTTSGW